MPAPLSPAELAAVSVPRLTLHHRGFGLHLVREPEGARYAFEITHRGHALHASAPEYGSPSSASRAARLFVDDALGSFEKATRALEE